MTVVYILGLFIQILDATIVNVALPALAREFDVEVTDVEWVVLGYTLAVAIGIPSAGWFGDRLGTRRVFLGALATFVVASGLCGLAQGLDQLIAARVLQGLAAGMITPIGSALLFRAYPLAERAKAATWVVSVAVVAPAVGPVLGGILVDAASWRWIFLVNLPIGAAAVALGVAWLEHDEPSIADPFDLVGFVLSAAGLALFVLGLSLAPDRGLDPLVTITTLLGAAGLIALVAFELRIEHPILALRLLGERLFRTMNVMALFTFGGFLGHVYLFSIFLQEHRGMSASATGLTQAPQAVGVFIISTFVGQRAYQAIGPRRLIVWGVLVAGIASSVFAVLPSNTSLAVYAVAMAVRGLAMGFVFVAMQASVYARVSLADTAQATSLFNTNRQVAGALGIALAAGLISLLADGTGEVVSGSGYRLTFGILAALFAPAVLAATLISDDDAAATRSTSS